MSDAVGLCGRERALKWGVRLIGCAALTAVAFIVCPMDWMAWIHERLGLGTMPTGPIVAYLTRSLSAMYAAFGALLVYLSTDVRRHGQTIGYLGWVVMAFGGALLGIDLQAGLPAHWWAVEGPMTIAMGAAAVALTRRR